MPTYKLTYFDFKGLGEPIRMMLSYLGKEFEDNRIALKDWPEEQKKYRFGKLPVLEIDGTPFYQSHAILRYLSHGTELIGKTPLENYNIDNIVGSLGDFFSAYAPMYRIEDPKAKSDFIDNLVAVTIPLYFKHYDEVLSKNNCYFANGKLSWADLYFHGWVEYLEGLLKLDLLSQYPNLKTGHEKVLAVPGIKEWVAKRPDTI